MKRLLLTILFALGIGVACHAQTWTPAGQMIGPRMLEFPLSLPDGTHLIPLRWVHARYNDSLYWFDIKSFMTSPRMYESQTLDFKQISDINDFDSDGKMDLWGGSYDNGGLTIFGVFTEAEHRRPHRTGMVYASTEVNTRFFGDIDGDGLNDDLSAEGEYSARVVYGDRSNPFIGPSYVELFDNTHELYPELPPTKVAVVGMLGGKPCIVQSYQLLPETSPIYELHELNMNDLRTRASKIRTRLLHKLNVGENRRYGNVVLRTPDVWWLFSSYGADSSPNGIKITQSSATLEPVSDYWKGWWEQYYGQGGRRGEDNIPRVIDGNRPFLREDYVLSMVDGIGTVRHAVLTLARLVDVESADVELMGTAFPLTSQYQEAIATIIALTPDVDGDRTDDFMVTLSYRDSITQQYQNSVSLYLTSQRPIVSVTEQPTTIESKVIDQGECWRIIDGLQCFATSSTSARIYDINGSTIATVTLTCSGSDVAIDKPRELSPQALWLRLDTCAIRLQ